MKHEIDYIRVIGERKLLIRFKGGTKIVVKGKIDPEKYILVA